MKLKHCTEEDCQKVLDFTVGLINLLGLPHHWMSIGWSTMSEFERFHAAVHEVCHMLHRRVETATRRSANLMHDHEFDNLWDGVVVELELMVDGLALALCRMTEVRRLWYGDEQPTTDPEAGAPPVT